jgi:hypothetical protein
MIFVLRIPLVESVLIVMFIVVFTLIVVISALVVALSVSFSVALEALVCLGWEDLSGSPLGPWYSDNLPFVVTSSREIFGEQVWWRAGSVTGQAERQSPQRQRV